MTESAIAEGRSPARMHGGSPGERRTLGSVMRQFVAKPSPKAILLGVAAVVGVRLWLGGFGWADPVVAAGVVITWPFQEWVLHRYLLHMRPLQLGGRRIDPPAARKHREHHRRPWDLDFVGLPVPTVVLGLVAGTLLFVLVFPSPALAFTAMSVYASMALAYEWTHYLTHAPYSPRSRWYAHLQKRHRLHHFKHERFWFSVTVPLVDDLLRTAPEPRAVPTSPTCRDLGATD